MIGDKKRDLIPARQMGLRTIQVDGRDAFADHQVADLRAAAGLILTFCTYTEG